MKRNESDQRRIFKSPIIKYTPRKLQDVEAFKSEDQFDEKVFVGGMRTWKYKLRGAWSHIKEAIFIGCMTPIESDAYASGVREHWRTNRSARLEGLSEEKR